MASNLQILSITADEAQPGDVWLGNGDIRISAVSEGPIIDYIPPGTDVTVTGPLVRLTGEIIRGQDRGYRGDWVVQPKQPMEVRRDEHDADLGGWAVVDLHGNIIWNGMFRQHNAQSEADELNISGDPNGRPYSVTRDLP